jgi:dihydrofolate reductase
MRRIIGAAFVSLDGVMQAPGGPEEDPTGGFAHGGWLTAWFDEALGNQVDTFFREPFDLLLGRKTYEIFAAHWPFFPDEDPIAAAFRRNRKYVLTRSDMVLDWEGSQRVADLDALARIKQDDGPTLVIQGSSTLYPQLLERGLIDRLVLMTAPVMLGIGKRLFGQGTPPGAWKLVEHRMSSTGVAMATLDRAGDVDTGDFGMADPTPQELARREKMRREG